MARRLRRGWENLVSDYWFIPTAVLVFVSGISVVLVEVDSRLAADGRRVGFGGSPGSARELLGAIASSTLTLAALVFSVTIIVLQLASGQFSPRVLRTFLRDKRNQLTLGVFLATFMYALLVLREVRDDVTGTEFVPGIAVSFAFALVVLSIGFFVQYIHNITGSIRVIEIIDRISRETSDAIERVHPYEVDAHLGAEHEEPGAIVRSASRGVVTSIDVDRLRRVAERRQIRVTVVPRPGDFVATGMPVVAIRGTAGMSDDDERDARSAIMLRRERDLAEDPAFGFRQLVDIAERALSPGVNDPTTATQCLDHLHDLLRRLVDRPLPPALVAYADGAAQVVVPQPTWEDYVALALDEIRHWGADSIQVEHRVAAMLDDLSSLVTGDRRDVLQARRSVADR